jgi:hypothetical protein
LFQFQFYHPPRNKFFFTVLCLASPPGWALLLACDLLVFAPRQARRQRAFLRGQKDRVNGVRQQTISDPPR